MASNIITLSKLDYNILKQIPLSIRTFKDTYELSELPDSIRNLLKNYLEREIPDINYSITYDCLLSISQYGDLEPITNIYDLVYNYFIHYMSIGVNEYPFDCVFGCKLKYYLHSLDTSIQETLITSEVDRIARNISTELSIPIEVVSINLKKNDPISIGVEMNYNIVLKINNSTEITITN